MKRMRLYKSEKLCSKTEIDNLYAHGTSIIAYPLRAVVLIVPAREERYAVTARFLISIPKKRVRHAVDRVLLRRRTREAYRLNRRLLAPVAEQGKTALTGFNWLASHNYNYTTIERSMQELLGKIAAAVTQESEP